MPFKFCAGMVTSNAATITRDDDCFQNFSGRIPQPQSPPDFRPDVANAWWLAESTIVLFACCDDRPSSHRGRRNAADIDVCGVGFTMSLFIGALAFTEGGAGYGRADRLAVIVASVLSGLVGYVVLLWFSRKPEPRDKSDGIQPSATLQELTMGRWTFGGSN